MNLDWVLKIIVALGVIGTVGYLLYTGQITSDVAVPIMTALMGYVFGVSQEKTIQVLRDRRNGYG